MPPSTGRRRKISLACEPCRVRKSRCDGGKPICATCQHRRLPLSRCVYTIEQNARMASNDEYISALHERIRQLEGAVRAQAESSQSSPQASGVPGDLGSRTGTPVRTTTEPPPEVAGAPSLRLPSPPATDTATRHVYCRDEAPKNQHARSVDSRITAMGTVASEDSLDGDITPRDEFYGNSSAASFIKETCNGVMTLNEVLNPPRSPPTRPRVGCAPSPRYWHNSASFTLPPRALADHLVARYFDRVFYLYPFIHRPSFDKAYRSLWEPAGLGHPPERPFADPDPDHSPFLGLGSSPNAGADSIVFHCALNAMFALGCHFSDWIGNDRDITALVFLNRSKSLMTLDFLESDPLGVVQALLIMTLFLQSTPFAGRCWNSVGIACRLAQGAGLHSESGGSGRPPLEKEMRRRVWHGCVVLDMLVSMTFGRPTMTTHASNVPLPSLTDEGDDARAAAGPEAPSRIGYFTQSIRLSMILEKILDRVYQPWRGKSRRDEAHHSSNFDAIIELDSDLASFEASVPGFLAWTGEGVIPASGFELLGLMQRNVLKGRFFYVRLMLHRPLLSGLWTSHRQQTSGAAAGGSGSDSSCSANALRSSLTVQCGSSCVRCAMDLLDLTYSTFEAQHGTAWWWSALYASTAGLVLVMALSCPLLHTSLDIHSLETSWGVCRAILAQLANLNASVQKSLDLLDRFYSLTCADTSKSFCLNLHNT
ncbi:fungal-specific transcription factor domain-containing protein [Microdochium trichocladiopsis]|uniref:Fungal-specific transcription factor domain-containing protein n=1 Tax=Microdochium trichocladiopsis TaxID=1682393 RepID=A0A9P8Y5G8_9PEZI|nr:fungal-specific transcription factor domain-containing protein [Microdochium trichocladiopsis]KAH7029927.1 fungal-specific transcription factor domain-containing protein [Microdochium trichocladiopsis]